MTARYDQYGSKIPEDLVLLWHDLLDNILKSKEDFKLRNIDRLDWYKAVQYGGIFVSAIELEGAIGTTDAYHNTDFMTAEEIFGSKVNPTWNKIDSVLHRWNETDGFYHA